MNFRQFPNRDEFDVERREEIDSITKKPATVAEAQPSQVKDTQSPTLTSFEVNAANLLKIWPIKP